MAYTTKQHQAILRCLEQRAEEALSANQLAEDLRREGCPVGLATIYRQLEKLEAAGRVHKVHTEEGAFFQFCPHPEADHGCFLLRCESCGRMVHLDCSHLEELYRHLEQQHHFRIDPRRTILTGRCRSCEEKEAACELQ
ncbi:transcriptional repressor [Oscillibacter valericigenes]|uniref:Fur family transcriptional regulator n=1 Tax=Oscillibacter valericigenes TaxID=351091 RepID=UPI001F263D4A|nr:transcriptional repressor [Oscillibacter valericigenes]MCF2664526.1 transcriptional repressor [Oscillibacter valericigenes]